MAKVVETASKVMETPTLVRSLEHTAARLLIAAERDDGNAGEMRRFAAQLQAMTAPLEGSEAE